MSDVVTKWLNTQLTYTKACTGGNIRNGTAWECFDLLIKHPTNRCCISPNRAECAYVQLHTHKLIPTPPTWQDNALTKRNIMYWPRAVLPTYLVLLCVTWCAAPLLHCDRPARNSASDWVMRRESSSTHPRQDRSWSHLKFLKGKASLTFHPA
jgi:hypothetical protein